MERLWMSVIRRSKGSAYYSEDERDKSAALVVEAWVWALEGRLVFPAGQYKTCHIIDESVLSPQFKTGSW